MIRNQQAAYIPQLFKFAQFVVATNKNAVKYATAGTPKKFWSVWKEQDADWLQPRLKALIPDRMPTEQDRNIVSLFSRERVFELIRYFILFDANVKKVCRYQQFFCRPGNHEDHRRKRRARQPPERRHLAYAGQRQEPDYGHAGKNHPDGAEGLPPPRGHRHGPQGAGRADCRHLRAYAANPRPRDQRTSSGGAGKQRRADVITSIINKFNTVERQEVKNPSRDIFVLVDESHRSNYGLMATRMRSVFPNACYIGFTGARR